MPDKKVLLPMQRLPLLQRASFPLCYSACCAIHYDFLLWGLPLVTSQMMIIPLWVSLLHQFIFFLIPFFIPISGTYIHFMLTCTTGFPFLLSPFPSSPYSWGLFCVSCFFLLYFLCHVHWARLLRQYSDQPEVGVAYMAFLVLCLYKKTGLRRYGTRKSTRAMIQMSIHCSTVTSFASSAPSFYPMWVI